MVVKYNKLVFIGTNSIDDRINRSFGISDLLAEKVDLEYWNVSEITYKEIITQIPIADLKVVNISSHTSFSELVKNNVEFNSTLFISLMTYNYYTCRCFYTLSRWNAHTLFLINGILPYPPSSFTTKYSKIFYAFKKPKAVIKKIKSYFSNLLLNSKYINSATHFILSCGKATPTFKVSEDTNILRGNSGDYETFLFNDEALTYNKYIVFIDDYLPYHPDIKIMGDGNIDPDLYFAQLDKIFQLLEKKYGCEVIIAAHPTSKYSDSFNPYGARKLAYGKTGSLIKNCIGVVSHASTALSYSVLYSKPIILINSDEIAYKIPRCARVTEMFSKELNIPIYSMDNPIGIDFPIIDNEAYISYKYNYLTNEESENIHNYQIILKMMI